MRTHLFDGDTNRLSKPLYCALSKRREQPATLGSTSPDTPYRSDWNTQYLLSFTRETTSCVGQQSSATACPMSMCSCTFHSSSTARIPLVTHHLTVYVCLLLFIAVLRCRLASCPRLLRCHHVCLCGCHNNPCLPPFLAPPTPLWEHLTPLIPRRGDTPSSQARNQSNHTCTVCKWHSVLALERG